MTQIKHSIVRIPTGWKQTSWLFTKCDGVEFWTTENKSSQWQEGGFKPGTSELQELQVQHPTTRPRHAFDTLGRKRYCESMERV